jgi:transcription elongation factor GreA
MKPIFLKKEPRIPFTEDGYKKIIEEKAKLLAERPEAVDHLRKSREMGDLSENGYYKASRARLSFLDARIRRIERLVKLGVIVKSVNSGRVEIGSTVTLTDGKVQFIYTIVGGYESDPTKNTVSYISPIGKALIGRKLSDQISVSAPAGIKKYTILKIEVQ